MLHLKAVRAKSGDRILPALYGDNYLILLRGEQRQITTQLNNADMRGEAAKIELDGFSLQ
jgi:hypothetical protein